MKKRLTILASLALALCLIFSQGIIFAETTAPASPEAATAAVEATSEASTAVKAPKYVFLFIGDGMSYPQVQATADYLGIMEDDDYMKAEPSLEREDYEAAGWPVVDGPKYLNFQLFPATGSAITYDSCSLAPDSASTGTSIATGFKTYSGSINVDETGTKKYTTIAEQLHQAGLGVGVISSVNLNHATPAAFYAHQVSRGSYYEIGEEMINSGFEYFSGGGLLKPTGKDKDKEDLYARAEAAGYKVVKTQAEAEEVSEGPVIIIDEHLADSNAMAYEIDRTDDMWSLADHVSKGIEVLSNANNEKGFFLMCEGGKIDWACHANDAATVIDDTKAFADAVQVAIDFAKDHADETLIVVTADHETGGMTIGFAGTAYDTYFSQLDNQKISYAKFDSDVVPGYVENKTPFEDVLKDVEKYFGLKASGEEGDLLVMTEFELGRLKDAYRLTVEGRHKYDDQEEGLLYGGYEPLTVTITHLLNNKSGIGFTSYSHTGLPVGVYAQGVGAENFNGTYDNTQIYAKMAQLCGVAQ